MGPLTGKTVLITGSARRIGLGLALATARAGADIFLHYGHSFEEAEKARTEIEKLGRQATLLPADLADPLQVRLLIEKAFSFQALFAIVNNAAVFETLTWDQTSLEAWNRHLAINLTAPFLLSQAFAQSLPSGAHGRIVNILDWRALRPGPDHFPYTISKAALAALTHSMAAALAPNITVNGLALGAILPPSDGGDTQKIVEDIPLGRWAELQEVEESLLFLLTGPLYITGEIIHVDGGRHLV